jgi:hypothetical protein
MTEEEMQALAAYIEEYIWREREEEGTYFYSAGDMVLKALRAYEGESK